MGNKHEVLGFRAKLWESGGKAPTAKGNRGMGWSPQFLALFAVF